MYKTIRQGENSLQYTILPQQDEGRTGPTVSLRKNGGHQRPPGSSRKRSIVAYIGLFFVCAIITFAILIPLMVTSDLMPTPSAWFYRNQKAREFRAPVSVKMSVDGRQQQQQDHILKGTPIRSVAPTTTTTSTAGPTTKSPEHSSPLWSDALSVTEFENLYKSGESIEQSRMNYEVLPNPEQTTTVGAVDDQSISSTKNLLLARARQRTMTSTVRPTTPPPSVRNYPKHFSLQKHEKTASGVVLQETKSIQVDTNTEDMAKAHQNWLQAHWSYVDPYLQWRNYAADDRVVLPLILGVALTMVVGIMLLCYLVKRKHMCRMCKKSANKRSENVEAQDEEDHTNLLTNDNQSEEE